MNFKKNIVSLYGKKGHLWLDNLPELVNYCEKKWDLTLLEPIDNLSYNYVMSGMQNNLPVILKIGFDKCEVQKEFDATSYFAGHGCVKVLDHDIDNGALLLERIIPGHALKSFFPEKDAQTTKIACEIIRDLQSVDVFNGQVILDQNISDQKKFSQLADWLKVFDKKFDKKCGISEFYLCKAKKLSKHLLATTTKTVLLHGDLHHDNILACGQDKWLAIDPKGVIGDPVYEVGSFIRNPWPEIFHAHDIKNILQNRVQIFAQYFDFDRQRIIDWVYVQSILSACWCIEDNLDFKENILLADIIEKL